MSKTTEGRRGFWLQLIAEQHQSGVSVRTLCREHGTSEHSFYQWRKRLVPRLPVKFALVETERQTRFQVEAVEVILTSGERLRIGPGVDATTLRLILSILREAR
jgi:transposase-like protein